MKTLKQKARQYFEEEMSGEPLTQEAVEEALVDFGQGKRQDQIEYSETIFAWSIIGICIITAGYALVHLILHLCCII